MQETRVGIFATFIIAELSGSLLLKRKHKGVIVSFFKNIIRLIPLSGA